MEARAGFALADLRRPLIAAPMAGGPTTPALVVAAGAAGGLGFLAAGYKSVAAVADEVDRVRAAGTDAFGVNVFVPDPAPTDLEAARSYRDALAAEARRRGVDLPDPRPDDDGFAEKLALLLDARVPAVSFTFGCPDADAVARLRGVGTLTLATVTSADEARVAVAAGVDALVVQGPAAGGHRATFDVAAAHPTASLADLHAEIAVHTDLPLVVAGGLTAPKEVAPWLDRAAAVQVGTALLDTDEAGTNPAHRAALRDPRFTRTRVTRAFSGRWARGLANRFVEEFTDLAPAAYPAVNQLTAPLRAAAARAGDADGLALWAGTSWRATPRGSVAEVFEGLIG
ncbi:nitronate monooxygenase [Propioniciclava coleopterorum]|uniref:Propionate 3-nitronate monooxygenase n=1 Tax=Propioniciclava coleopterorum TaxID=2714937 RepID=A0A6G7Y955_9ACTN|nr:nitronate monooxygenase [Propioniciclava coleopterorum]QIK73178.1 nitronate monooxygenase [Propioniciclava coleopterorum]